MRLSFVASIGVMWFILVVLGLAFQVATGTPYMRDSIVAGAVTWLLLRSVIEEL